MPPKSTAASASRVRSRSGTASTSNAKAPSNSARATNTTSKTASVPKNNNTATNDKTAKNNNGNNNNKKKSNSRATSSKRVTIVEASNGDNENEHNGTNMMMMINTSQTSTNNNDNNNSSGDIVAVASSPAPRGSAKRNSTKKATGTQEEKDEIVTHEEEVVVAEDGAAGLTASGIAARTRARREQERKEREAREKIEAEEKARQQQQQQQQREAQVLDSDVDTSNSALMITGETGETDADFDGVTIVTGFKKNGRTTTTKNNNINKSKTTGGTKRSTKTANAIDGAPQNNAALSADAAAASAAAPSTQLHQSGSLHKLAFNRSAPLSAETHLKRLLPEEVATCNSFELIIKTVCEEIAVRSNAVDDLAQRLREVLASLSSYLETRVQVRSAELEAMEGEEAPKRENFIAAVPVEEDAAVGVGSLDSNKKQNNNNNNNNNMMMMMMMPQTSSTNYHENQSNNNNNNTENDDDAADEDIPLFVAAAAAKVEKIAAAKLAEQRFESKLKEYNFKMKVARFNLKTVETLLNERVQVVSDAVDKMEEEWKSDEMIRLMEELDEDIIHPVAFAALSQVNTIQGHLNPGAPHVVTEKQKVAKKARLDAHRAKKEQLEKKLAEKEAKKAGEEERKKKREEELKKKEEEKLAKKKEIDEKRQKLNELNAAKQAVKSGRASGAKRIVEDNELRGKPILDAVVYKPAPLGHFFPRILRCWVQLACFCKTLKLTQMPLGIFVKWVVDRPFERQMVQGEATIARDIVRGLCEAINHKNRTKLSETLAIFDEKGYSKDHVWLLHAIDVVETESKRRAVAAVKLRNFRRARAQMTAKQRRAIEIKEKAASNAEKKQQKGKGNSKKKQQQEEEDDEDDDEDEDDSDDDDDDEDDEEEEEEENEDDEFSDDDEDDNNNNNNTSSDQLQPDDANNVTPAQKEEEAKLPEELFAEMVTALGTEIAELKPVRWHAVSPGRRITLLEILLTLFLETELASDAATAVGRDMRVQSALLDKRLKDIQDECDKQVKEINKKEELKTNPQEMKNQLLKVTKKRDRDFATATQNFNFRYLKDSDHGYRALPLGRDRYKRLYWLFPAEAKLFVETVPGETVTDFPLERVAREDEKGDQPQQQQQDEEEEEDEDDEENILMGKNSLKNYEWELQSPALVTPAMNKPNNAAANNAQLLLDDEEAPSPRVSSGAGKNNNNNKKAAANEKNNNNNSTTTNNNKKLQPAEIDPEFSEEFPENIWGFVPFEQVRELTKQLDARGVRESQLRKNLGKCLSMIDKVVDQSSAAPRMMTRSRAQHDGYENRFRTDGGAGNSSGGGHRSYF